MALVDMCVITRRVHVNRFDGTIEVMAIGLELFEKTKDFIGLSLYYHSGSDTWRL